MVQGFNFNRIKRLNRFSWRGRRAGRRIAGWPELGGQYDYEVALALGQGFLFCGEAAVRGVQGGDGFQIVDKVGRRCVLGLVNDAEVHPAQLAEIEQAENDHNHQGQEKGPEQRGTVAGPHFDGRPGKVDFRFSQHLFLPQRASR